MRRASLQIEQSVFAMAFPDVRRMMLLRRAIPMRCKKNDGRSIAFGATAARGKISWNEA